jgi:hypothetical protein
MVLLEVLGKLKKFNDIMIRTRDLPACSIAPKPSVKCSNLGAIRYLSTVLD